MSKLEESLKLGEHQKLSQLIGEWEGQTKTWFGPGDPSDESPMTGTIKPLFDGRFLMHEYKGSLQGKPFEGLAIYGYNISLQKFESAWVDTFHMGTGILFSEAAKGDKMFSALGHYQAGPDNPEKWGWRTDMKVENSDKIIITAYNISPEGEEFIATETVYNRRK